MLVGGLTGAFFEPLALAYGLAVLASMAGRADRDAGARPDPAGRRARSSAADPPLMRVLKRGYARALRPALRSRCRGRSVAVVVAIVARRSLYPRLGQDLFPTFKEPDFLMHFVTKPGTSVPEQDREVTALQHQLLAIPGVAARRQPHRPGAARRGSQRGELLRDLAQPVSRTPTTEGPERGPGGRDLLPRRLQRRPDLPARADRRGAHQRHHRGRRRPRLRPRTWTRCGTLGNQLAARLARIPGLVDVQPGRARVHPAGRGHRQPGRRPAVRADARRASAARPRS